MVQQTIQIEGIPLHVIDTAGLRDHPEVDEVERIGIARAWQQIEKADAVLFMHDLTRSHDPAYAAADQEIQNTLHATLGNHTPLVHVWNKADACEIHSAEEMEGAMHIRLSAKTGIGLPQLRAQLLQMVGWQSSSAQGVFMARERHVQALNLVAQHLQMGHDNLSGPLPALDVLAEELRLAQNALNTITGEFSSDDLLGVIFTRFCIGK